MARRLEVEIVGDASSLNRALKGASSSFKGSVGQWVKGAVVFNLANKAVDGLGMAIHAGISEFAEHTKVAAQTNAVIKSTGGVAGISAKHVGDLANSILRKTGIDDEAIQTTENLLLGFTNLRNEVGKGNNVFDRATQLVTDYSVRTGKSAAQASIIFGKALNDPIKGLGGLSRAGIILTDDQKKLIKTWVEHGDKLKAQKYLLGLLEERYKGAAEAAGKTLPGQINIAKETFKNFAGDLVAKTIPVLERTIEWLRDHWPEINAAINRFWADVKPIFVQFAAIAEAVVEVIRDHWSTIGPIVKQVGKVFEDVAKNIVTMLKIVTALLRGDWSEAWKQAKNLAVGIFRQIKDEIKAEAMILIAVVRGIGTKIKDALVGALTGIGSAAWNQINNIGSVIAEKAGAIAGWGLDIARHLAGGIVSGLSGIGGKIVSIIKSAVNTLIDRINSALSFHFTVDTHIPGVGKKSFGFDSNIPHLASGGPLGAGQMALVGERGPELFMPSTSGTVIPNGAGRGGPIYLVTPDGKALAEFIFDGMRGQAQIYKQRTGRTAFA